MWCGWLRNAPAGQAKQLKESLPTANSHAPELVALNKEHCEGESVAPVYNDKRVSACRAHNSKAISEEQVSFFSFCFF